MKKMHWVSGVAVMLFSAHAIAGMFDSDGRTYEECMEGRRNEIRNSGQFAIAAQYCRQRHPLPKIDESFDPENAVPVDPVELHVLSGTEPANAIARPAIVAVSLTHVALAHDGMQFGSVRSPDFRWYMRADITNRNRFSLTAIVVGVMRRGVTRCDWGDRSYTEVYQCNGYAGSGMSGSFRCSIPDSERRQDNYCVIGLGTTSTMSDFNRYLSTR